MSQIYELILNVIEEEIIKCSQGITVPKLVLEYFNDFHERTCNKEKYLPIERVEIYSKEYSLAYHNQGTLDSCDLDWDTIIDQYENDWHNLLDLHLTHNHPLLMCANSLSQGDIECLFYSYFPSSMSEELEGLHYPLKSVSTESPNGSRMTLVRGDNFNVDDEDRVIELGGELEENCKNYVFSFYGKKGQIMEKYKDNFDNVDDLKVYANRKCISEMGRFEQSKEFKKIQKEMRKLNCKLTVSYPTDFEIDSIP